MEHAGAGLEKVLVRSLRLSPRSDAPVLAWSLVCGSAVAERTRALTFQNGELRVEVADAGWKSELQTLAQRYLVLLNRYTDVRVSRIEFVVARLDAAKNAST